MLTSLRVPSVRRETCSTTVTADGAKGADHLYVNFSGPSGSPKVFVAGGEVRRGGAWLLHTRFETIALPAADLTYNVYDPADPLAEVDVSDAVDRALDGLSPEHRAVIVLRFYAHLSEQETADALGIAVGTVKSRTSRALAALAGNEHLAETPEGKTP